MEKLNILFFVSFLLFLPQLIFAQKQAVDLIVRNGTVVTMNAPKTVIENGAIAVRKSEIVAVGTVAEITQKFSSSQTIDARGKVVIPGLINAHTHIPMTLFRGIADDLDLQEWLQKYIFPAEAKNVTEDFVRVGTRLGLAEMIRGGTTTYCDMYYFEDAIADETSKAGMRGVLGETLIDFSVPDNKTFADAKIYAENFVKKWQGNTLIVPAIAPHAPYTVSEEHLMEAKTLSDKLNAPLIMHLAEAQSETDFVMKEKRMRSIEYVNKIGFLSDKLIAAHVIQANTEELEILKKFNVGIAHNPQSNMKIAAGVAPVPQMLARDLAVGLGTDGAASNNDLDMWEEMDTAAKLHKLITGDPKVLTAQQAFEMATIRGARALHLEKIIGSIEAGKRADIVVVDFDNLNQTPFYNLYSQLVYATKASDVHTVIVNGKVLMLNKRLLTLNENVIKKDANAYRQKIINSLSIK
ncbi:MAG: amidohydrolase [Acidobacteria bacterium]|jgi:5-methylthioadenosine/S-adenosylhomocysteine deaminase|nr:amidohydrolase [Acidobacteriota bacterium]